MASRFVTLLVLVHVLVFVGRAVSEEPAPDPPNCLFIVLDTTAAAHLSSWGYERETTPNLDRLAREGFAFKRAFSQAPSTLPSTWSMLTGRYPVPRPAERHDSLHMTSDYPGLAESFHAAGYFAAAFSENPYITEATRFDAGFDRFSYYRAMLAPDASGARYRDHDSTRKLFDDARSSIEEAGAAEKPWFCYLHLLRPHEPYLAPAPEGTQFMSTRVGQTEANEKAILTQFRTGSHEIPDFAVQYLVDCYDGNLAYVDAQIGELHSWLEQRGDLANTVVVVTSDHGEAFMDHGMIGHGFRLWDVLLHVPLIIWTPDSMSLQDGASEALVEIVDVFPTVAELLKLPLPDRLHGRSLVPAMTGQSLPDSQATYAQTLSTELLSVRIGDIKMICTANQQTRELSNFSVYDLSTDPGELNDLYDENYPIEPLLERARWYVDQWPDVDRNSDITETDAETREQLEAIGYLGN